jgi:hypothetical protein
MPDAADPAAGQQTFTRAKLKFVEPGDGGPGPLVDEFTFPFNPKDYSITKAAKWRASSNKQGLSPAEYNGPVPSSVTIEMFLDATTEEEGNIATTINKILAYVNPDPKSKQNDKPSAPHAHFIWGTAIEFYGFLESVAVKYTLFRQNGNPVRGTATLTLKELGAAEQAQNPTSGSEPGSRSHRVVAGDSLASIAYREYGSATRWRRIADANPAIHDPMRLSPGMSLLVPPA